MKLISLFALLACTFQSQAQQENFDIISYTAPAGWAKETRAGLISYSITNKQNNSWCMINLVKSAPSLGDIDKDFADDWAELIEKPYKVTDAPMVEKASNANGWKMKPGAAKFKFNNADALAALTTFSGFGKRVAVITLTNSQEYIPVADKLITSLVLQKTTAAAPANTIVTNKPGPAKKDRFAFNTTNFDDGWTSTVQEDWVETTKGTVKVFLHYAKEGTVFPADPAPLINAAWNILVAPRYSNLKNYKTTYINMYNMPYIGMGYATENKTGQSKFIVLFRRSGGWLEVAAPDKQTFIQYFQFDPETVRWDSNIDLVNALDKMMYKNKFAVSASDISATGEWTDRYSSNSFWSNYYTGAYEGMSTYTSSEKFVFGSGQSYSWDLIAANSYGGRTNVASAKGAGTFKSLNNWQLYFSNIEGKAKTYDVYFTAVKNGRVLFMNDAKYPGSGVFKGFSKKQ